MQAPTVQNQVNITSSPTQGAKQQNAPDVPFNQMLSQQISDRNNANDASKAAATNTSNNANKVSEPNKANDSNKANDANNSNDTGKASNSDASPVSKQSAPSNTDTTTATDATAVTAVTLIGKDKSKIADDALLTDSSTAVPVSAELMALVANHLSLASTKQTDPTPTAVTPTAAITATIAITPSTAITPAAALTPTAATALDEINSKVDDRSALASGRTIASAKDSLSKQVDVKASSDKTPATELAGKEGAIKPNAGFAATIAAVEQTADSKQSLQLATSKLQEALPAVATGAAPQLQQAALNIAQTIAGHPADKLTPQVGSPGWDQALGQKVVWMVAGSQQSASLTLNPPDLGPMQVVLSVTNGHADAAFTSSQPEVRLALEAALPKLREMMSDAGIQLGQATISTGMPNQQNKSGEQTGQSARGFSQAGDSIEPTARVTGATRIIGGQGLVDTFA